MNRQTLGLTSALLVLGMGAAALVAGLQLPADLQLPVHWGLDGTPDRFAGKWVGLLMPAAIAAALSLLFWCLPWIEPRSRNLSRSQGLYLWVWASVLLLSLGIDVVVLSAALEWGIPASRMIAGTLGVMFVIIGNQLGKSRSMFLIGLRTPWTLASEEVWVRTQRLAGKLMVLGGLIDMGAALMPLSGELLATALAATIAVAAIVPIVYSFLLWRREPKRADDPSSANRE